MKTVQLLDCTLRDGGYVNDWKFGRGNLVSIFERLVDSGVDIIEVGFLDERRPFDCERSIMPNTASADKIFGELDKKGAMVVGMIDYGTCALENLQKCEDSYLDGIRVIFKKHLMHEAMEYCRAVKALGYKVFAQLVSITSYNDEELLELIELVNDVKPYAVSMVDTYGLLHPDELLHYYELLDEHVSTDVQIGFHPHNNFQLAYANSLAFLEKDTRHSIVVDGTLYGMGKSAGNAPLELLAMRLNDKFGKSYKIDPMLEAVEESILNFYESAPWGYKMFFYLCALNKCHPNYLTYFEGKNNLSVSSIDKLLALIEPEDKKLLYDKAVAEALYDGFLAGDGDDTADKKALHDTIGEREVLIVGPGKNIELQRAKVARYIEQNKPYVIAINYLPSEINVDCVFVTNRRRYHQMTIALKEQRNLDVRLLATSNISCRGGDFDFIVNRAPLLEHDESITDNSLIMLLTLLSNIGVTSVSCAGLDGYSDKEDNYFKPEMEYNFVKPNASYLNRHMKERIAEFRESMNISFITYSAYDAEENIYGASI